MHPVAELGHASQCDQCLNERAEYARRIDADNARIRHELHDRLNRLDDHHIDALAHELADRVPDAVVDALNEIGAP
jgi:hypothetical protein